MVTVPPTNHSLGTLIRHSAPHLKKLKLDTAPPQFENLLEGICFPQLEEIVIHECSYDYDDEGNLMGRNLLQTVLKNSPKCKSIRFNNLETLYAAVPQEKYELLTKVECCDTFYHHNLGYDVNLLGEIMENIIEKKPALRKLLIKPPCHLLTKNSDSIDEEADVS